MNEQINISFSASNKALEELTRIDINSPKSDNRISYLIKNKINVPFITVIVPKGIYFYRARKIEDIAYTNKEQISYNKNLDKISIGRANKRHQSIFYASHKIRTTLFETSSITKFGKDQGRESFIVGQWYVKESFSILCLISRLDIIDKKDEIFKEYVNLLSKNKLFQNSNVKKHLEFFSNQFAIRAKGNENIYKISSEYYNHCLNTIPQKIYGILYPSVELDCKDLNVAILPEAVDDFLALVRVYKYEFQITENLGLLYPLRFADVDNYRWD